MARKKQIIRFEANDKLFKALIENSWDVIVLIDKKARVKYASPSIIRMFGRDYHEFTKISGIKYIHPIDAPRVTKGLAQLILKPKEPIHMEMRIRHNSGQYLWIEAIATNLLSDENINGIVVNFHDITQLKLSEQRKDEFISVASHELRQPITSLKVYLQIIRKRIDALSPERLSEYVSKMSDQIMRMERFVNDLYDTSRIREGKLSLAKEKFKLIDLIKETCDDTERNYGTHRILLNVKFNGVVFADRVRIQQVLINLLGNAIKYSPNADKIKIKVWKIKSSIYISVTDYGVGISKDHIAKIYDRFYQVGAKNKNVTGLGLGLYITYNIIRQHKGEVKVKSRVGKSTTITFYIPKK